MSKIRIEIHDSLIYLFNNLCLRIPRNKTNVHIHTNLKFELMAYQQECETPLFFASN